MKLRMEVWRRLRTQAMVFIISLILSLWFHNQGWLQRLEYAIYDVRQTQLRADTVIDDRVKVVLIDEFSLAYLSPTLGAFPWPRTVYAELIDFFQLAGAKAVLFDILFTEREASNNSDWSENDLRLAEASAGYPGTVHSMLFSLDVEDDSVATLNTPLPENFIERFSIHVTDLDDEVNTFALPITPITEATPYLGVVGVDPDDDGIYRRIKPLWEYQGAYFPALSITPLLMPDATVRFNARHNELSIGNYLAYLDDRNRMLINFYGDMKPISIASVFQTWDKLMAGEVSDLPLDPYEFENAIVYIGSSAIGLDDVKPVVNDAKAPGVYLHASALSNLLKEDVLTPSHYRGVVGWTVAMTLVSIMLAFNMPFYSLKISFLIGVPLGYWFLTGWQLSNNVQPILTVPLLGFALGWSWSFTYLSFTEGASKRRVKRMLSQFVSEAMLDEALESPDEILHAGVGKSETLSILFSDVRGFTKLSETLAAERVVKLLNTHFSEMADVIFEYNGTLDKFIGDAIMAYWGMPIKVEHHASLSVKAALAMCKALDRVNQSLQEANLPSIEIGIGINTGEAILGNIGSDRKLDYTVIGDAVNVASRMEGVTKLYGVSIVISEITWLAMAAQRPCLLLDFVRVKGKSEPMGIFSPLPDEQEAPERWQENLALANLSMRAFAYYQTQQWTQAEALYRALNVSTLRTLYLSRIEEFRRHPPPPNWDGVYTFEWK